MRQPFGRGVRNSELQGDSSAVARPSIVVHALAVLALGAAIANACSANGSDGASDGDSNDGPSTGSGNAGAGAGGSSSGNGGDVDFDAGGPGSGGSDRDACAAVSSEAEVGIQPADIIIAVDTSGSMDQEAAEVQANLNTFASLITASGIDVHVVLIAGSDVCIPAPLGSGSCGGADEKLPEYRHVQQGVGSSNGLQVILDTYPQWKDSLRSNATKTLAIVSDDNSDLSAAAFSAALLALDPPTFQGFKFDAIVAFEDGSACFGCVFSCGSCASKCCDKSSPVCEALAADEGSVYKELVMQTGGVIGDLCEQNFDPVFQDMATGIVSGSKVSCEFEIPDQQMLDPNKVNVSYTPGGGGMASSVLNVPGGVGDCGPNGGWYYDDPQNPTTITLCPATCTVVQTDAGAKIDVLFGCETQIAPPR
jgi:hypothetical protein